MMNYGMFGFGQAEPECPPGSDVWCYNPLVMHMRTRFPGVLSKGGATEIRDKFKLSLSEAGYIPTDNLQALKTPTQAVTDAVAGNQPALATTLPYQTLFADAILENIRVKAGGKPIILRPTIHAPPPPAPAPTRPMATRAGTLVPKPAGEIPWLWIGIGVVALGGIAFVAMRKK
jgi:hypothetical protein